MDNNYLNQIQNLLNKNKINNSTNKIQSDLENMKESSPKNDNEIVSPIIKEKNSNNIDDIPIKGGSNFNELLEKEMLKEQNEGYGNNEINENIEPKFKYIPKKRTDIISAPTNTKKYKYYSDNFKSKKKKKEKNEEKKDTNFNIDTNNSKTQKKENYSNYNIYIF